MYSFCQLTKQPYAHIAHVIHPNQLQVKLENYNLINVINIAPVAI